MSEVPLHRDPEETEELKAKCNRVSETGLSFVRSTETHDQGHVKA